jgi:hypothetical protein
VLQDNSWVRVATAIETPGWKAVTPAAAIWAPMGGTGSGTRRLIEVGDGPWDEVDADEGAEETEV